MKLTFPTRVIRNTPVTSIIQARRNLSQPFGVNWAEDPNLYTNMGMLGHDGIDIPLFNGTPVYAAHKGIAWEVDQNDDTDGLGVELWDPDQKIRTIYWHNQENVITKKGEWVECGQLIGYSGATGKAYGPHLHFGLYECDDKGNITNYSNGYHGAINPLGSGVEWSILTAELRIVRAVNGKDVFRLRNGEKDLFLNAEAFQALDGRWDKIETVTQEYLDDIKDGYVLIAVKQE